MVVAFVNSASCPEAGVPVFEMFPLPDGVPQTGTPEELIEFRNWLPLQVIDSTPPSVEVVGDGRLVMSYLTCPAEGFEAVR
jgi:hypothetical protein